MSKKSLFESLEARQLLAVDAYDWKAATIKANGFIDGIVYSPSVPGLSYIHTDMGGAYRYDASRAKWTNITDFAKYNDSAGKHMGVETLAIDPTTRTAFTWAWARTCRVRPCSARRTADTPGRGRTSRSR